MIKNHIKPTFPQVPLKFNPSRGLMTRPGEKRDFIMKMNGLDLWLKRNKFRGILKNKLRYFMEYTQSKFLIKLKDYRVSFLVLGAIGIIIGFFKYDYFFRFFAFFLGVGVYFALKKANIKNIDLINLFLLITLFVNLVGSFHNYVELSKNAIISKGVVKSKGGYGAYQYANIEFVNLNGTVQLESVESAISNRLKQDATVWIKYSKMNTSLIIASVDKLKIDNSKNLMLFIWNHEPILSNLILIAIVYIIFLGLLGFQSWRAFVTRVFPLSRL